MDANEFVKAINEREAHIRALTEYAKALETALGSKRGEEAQERAYSETWDKEIQGLRYEHGLRVDLTPR